jgi:hypothetical protein
VAAGSIFHASRTPPHPPGQWVDAARRGPPGQLAEPAFPAWGRRDAIKIRREFAGTGGLIGFFKFRTIGTARGFVSILLGRCEPTDEDSPPICQKINTDAKSGLADYC